MSTSTGPTRDELLTGLRHFLDQHIVPLEARFFAAGFVAVEEELEELRGEVKRRGWWAPQLPSELGGMGLGLVGFAHVGAVLGRSPLGHYVFHSQAPDSGNLEILAAHATAEQRRRFLEPLARGDVRSCFAMTEPQRPGSNPVWMDTRARRDGDDWVINGRKWFASSAEGAAFAVVMAVTSPDAAPHRRASLLLVPTGTPGYRLVRNLPVMGERGSGWASHAEVSFEECRVPGDHLLGEEGAGFAMAQERLGAGRIHHAMRWIGIGERAFDLLCQRLVRRQIKPDESLGAQPLAQAWVAESRVELDAARLLVLEVAERLERQGSRAVRTDISLVKLYVAGVMERVLDRALQAHGGLGMLDDTPLAYFFRHERAARIYDGPDEVHKIVAAKRILARYRDAG